MQVHSTPIDDDFAEAFGMRYVRLIITAANPNWATIAAREATGFASSIIACDVEAGIESTLTEDQTPDGRPGISILLFGFTKDSLEGSILKRIGQCVLTCATTAVFDGGSSMEISKSEHDPEPDPQEVSLGEKLRFFGDGYQKSKAFEEQRIWRIPVMEGEFVIQDKTHARRGIAGGNFLIQSKCPQAGLLAAERAVEAISNLPGVITPFPGGIARSGSKVGSKYEGLKASTYDAFCPSLKSRVETKCDPETQCVYEIIINGVNYEAVRNASRVGIHAACEGEGSENILRISAGNYGGNLGKFHFKLHEVLS